MKTFCLRKAASRLSLGIALVALLLASSATGRADDKKKNAPASKPAPSQKAPPAAGGSSSSGNHGGNHAGGGPHTTSGTGGGRPTGNGGGTNINNHSSSGTSPAAGGSGTSSSDHGGKHHAPDAGGAGDVKHKPDNSGKTRTTYDAAGTRKGGNGEVPHTTGSNGGTPATNSVPGTRKAGKAEGGRGAANTYHPATVGSPVKTEVVRFRGGSEATIHRLPNGRLREVHVHDVTIVHGHSGWHHTIVERPDHTRIVVDHFGHGYVQRPFVFHNHEFASRTYFYHGRPYAQYYRGYPYRGVVLHGYVPYRYYNSAFYGWAYHPWQRPVYYSWGWAGSPWSRHYNYYFTPYRAYPSASFWLTDYLIASSLQSAYQERLANQSAAFNSPPDAGVMLSEEVKQEIAAEVQRQLALENSERQGAIQGSDLDIESSGLPRILAEAGANNPRIFLVASSLDVTDAQGQECTLAEGDVLRLSEPPTAGSNSAYLQVVASQNRSCSKGSAVQVEFADLQEMQNHMRAGIDQGLQDLHTHQGGLPAPPSSAEAPPVPSAFAPIAPPADPNASNELQRQAQEAEKLNQEVENEVKKVRPPR
jgi:hypothetical protein